MPPRNALLSEDETAAFLSRLIESRRRPAGRARQARIIRVGRARTGALATSIVSSSRSRLVRRSTAPPARFTPPALTIPRGTPTLALAQRLWPDPSALLTLADADASLFTHGMLTFAGRLGRAVGGPARDRESACAPGRLASNASSCRADDSAWCPPAVLAEGRPAPPPPHCPRHRPARRTARHRAARRARGNGARRAAPSVPPRLLARAAVHARLAARSSISILDFEAHPPDAVFASRLPALPVRFLSACTIAR